jgi:hypothetical protein
MRQEDGLRPGVSDQPGNIAGPHPERKRGRDEGGGREERKVRGRVLGKRLTLCLTLETWSA